MAPNRDAPGGPIGRAIANLTADAVAKALQMIVPHANRDKVQATDDHMSHTASQLHGLAAPLAAHILDTDVVHPMMVPVLKRLAGRE